ncbi:Extracellular_nuclease [Hexamita inflata]|uniref:Extracellular nuclease n=1 Tax=Hexamita inflata TaxID=28002 RepID=A0AA86UN86_9EUKA|nr:Extracellular nuclease [Hexamita inflata]
MIFPLLLAELYPGKYGKELRELLNNYTAEGHKTLGYSLVRKHLYSYVYNSPADNAVYCAYTGSKMPCGYGQMNSDCNADLNCEHTVPQSFFSKQDPMVSDIHHLRAVWKMANSARSDFAFKELPDKNINMYYGDNFQKNPHKPKDPENWSAAGSQKFTPRNQQKGDTARAVAYFYVRYPTQAGSVTKTFASVDTMIEWDEKFEPSQLQMEQYHRSVEVQGNKNPFQEEKGLVARAYCDMSKNYPCSQYK